MNTKELLEKTNSFICESCNENYDNQEAHITSLDELLCAKCYHYEDPEYIINECGICQKNH